VVIPATSGDIGVVISATSGDVGDNSGDFGDSVPVVDAFGGGNNSSDVGDSVPVVDAFGGAVNARAVYCHF